MEDLKTIRVIYNPFLGVMSMYKSGRPEPAGGWSFAHDPVVFLDLFLGIPDNVADCSSIPPRNGTESGPTDHDFGGSISKEGKGATVIQKRINSLWR